MNVAAGQAVAPSLTANPLRDVPGAKPQFLDFFAGSGLVSQALERWFELVWANDVCPKKALVFRANHPENRLIQGSVAEVCGAEVPQAALSWASFPCQDLSLAGPARGIRASRSGLVWQWLRVMDEMPKRPPLVVAENVVGLLSSREGSDYVALHQALEERGYRVGAMVLDAVRFLPQSRPRVFVVGLAADVPIAPTLLDAGPNWLHPTAVVRVAGRLPHFVWWRMPEPPARKKNLSALLDLTRPCHDAATSQKNLDLIPPVHWSRLEACGLDAVPGYRRIRNGRQVLELRFDDVAGCLRTPAGGSSRQLLVVRQDGQWRTRLLCAAEAARLMGAPARFRLPVGETEAYRAMGDAVAAPVAAYLARHLLVKLLAGRHGIS